MKNFIIVFSIITFSIKLFSQNINNTSVADILKNYNKFAKINTSVKKEMFYETFNFSSFKPQKIIFDESKFGNYYRIGYDSLGEISKVTSVVKNHTMFSIQRLNTINLNYKIYTSSFNQPDGGRLCKVNGFIIHVDTVNFYFNYIENKLVTKESDNIGAIMPLDNKLNVITYLIYRGSSVIYFGETCYKDTLGIKNIETSVIYIPKHELKVTEETKLNEFNLFFNRKRDLYNYGFDIANVHLDISYPYSYYPLWIYEDNFLDLYK